MPLPESYLEYPRRRRGNDHDWFDYLPLPRRAPLAWPHQHQLALFATVAFEHYPIDVPLPLVRPASVLPIGDHGYIQSTLTDYANRIGAYRLFDAFDTCGLKATALVNSEVAVRYPRLIEEILSRNWEIVGYGTDMSRIITGQMARNEEAALIGEALTTLRSITGQPVTGWHSPAHSQSLNTLALLADAGIEYVLDWVNDDLPYAVRAGSKTLHMLPMNNEWADSNIVGGQRQLTEEIYLQGIAAYRLLRDEARSKGARMLSLPLHPAVSGQPFRIATAEKLLEEIAREGCWSATGSEIIAAFANQSVSA